MSRSAGKYNHGRRSARVVHRDRELQGRPADRPCSVAFGLPQQGQKVPVAALLGSDVFPARSTAFTTNVFSPKAVA
jgi:hypothetical protein